METVAIKKNLRFSDNKLIYLFLAFKLKWYLAVKSVYCSSKSFYFFIQEVKKLKLLESNKGFTLIYFQIIKITLQATFMFHN